MRKIKKKNDKNTHTPRNKVADPSGSPIGDSGRIIYVTDTAAPLSHTSSYCRAAGASSGFSPLTRVRRQRRRDAIPTVYTHTPAAVVPSEQPGTRQIKTG